MVLPGPDDDTVDCPECDWCGDPDEVEKTVVGGSYGRDEIVRNCPDCGTVFDRV